MLLINNFVLFKWGCYGFDGNIRAKMASRMLTLRAQKINANKIKNAVSNMFGGNQAVAFA